MFGIKTVAIAAVAAGFLFAPALMGTSSASAAPCVIAPVGTYTASGFSCSVDGVTFSSINVSPTVSGTGIVTLGNFVPFSSVINGSLESGLSLTYAANTGTAAGSQADVAWIYNVSGNLLDDAYLALSANVTGTGTSQVNEALSNGTTLSLASAGSTTAVFAPIANLGVIKDQNNFAGSAGSATASILTNAFSTTTPPVNTPEPASLAIMGVTLVGLGAIRRRRKQG